MQLWSGNNGTLCVLENMVRTVGTIPRTVITCTFLLLLSLPCVLLTSIEDERRETKKGCEEGGNNEM